MDNIFMYDAVPTWSGFLYQGRIAVYLAVKKIIELKDAGKDSEIEKYKLELEKCEDIAIVYMDKIYDSIYQVKNEKEHRINSYKAPLTQLMLEKGFCKKNRIGSPLAYLHVSKKLETANRELDESVSERLGNWKNAILNFYSKLKEIYDKYDESEEILEELVVLMKNNSQTICINRKEYKNKYSELERMCEELYTICSSKSNTTNSYNVKNILFDFIKYLDEKLYVEEISDEVKIYQYENGENYCSGSSIFEYIVNLIEKYKGQNCTYTRAQFEYIADIMINEIEEKILVRHKCMQENKSSLYRIPLSEFKERLDGAIENNEQEANILALKRINNNHLEEYCHMCQRNNDDICRSTVCKIQQPEYRKEILEKNDFIKYCYNLNPECDKQIYDRICLGNLLNRDGMVESVFPIIKNVPDKYFIEDGDKTHIKINNKSKAAYTTAISNIDGYQTVENIEKAMKVNQGLIETIFDADQLITTRLEVDSNVWDSSYIKVKPDDLNDTEMNIINNQNSIYVPKRPAFVKAEAVIKKMENVL